MSIKSKVFAAAATLTLVGGVGAVTALSAGAATPSCGHDCIDVFSREFGTHSHPNFVLDVWQQGARVGQPIILFRTSNSDPAEDFTVSFQGLTSDFYAAGMVSNAVTLHYGCAGQFGNHSCSINSGRLGVRVRVHAERRGQRPVRRPRQHRRSERHVGLVPCGVSAKTVWILDLNDSPDSIGRGYVPLINGSDTNFSHPFVLHYPGNGHPTDTPRPLLNTWNLQKFSNGHRVRQRTVGRRLRRAAVTAHRSRRRPPPEARAGVGMFRR